MKALNRKTAQLPHPYPERILQFGGGNFLRGFADWIIDVYNEQTNEKLGVLVVKPTESGDYQEWRDQDGLYHLLTKGIEQDELIDECRLIRSVSRIIHPYREWEAFLESATQAPLRFIISNTTESGIRFSEGDEFNDKCPREFPAKLTRWLYRRFRHFDGEASAACYIIPTELLVDNGKLLRDTVLQYSDHWSLGHDFARWITDHNVFCNTLVDRIIPGVDQDKLESVWQQVGYRDVLITQGEPYHLWAIEAPAALRKLLPLDKTGLNVIYTDELATYRSRKIRILNGAHTAMVPVAYLYGLKTVRETVEHPVLGAYVEQLIGQEIIPSMPGEEEALRQYAATVLDRFRNSFINHYLITISLNSVTKFRARLLPTIQQYLKRKGELPHSVVFALAALIRFYRGDRNGQPIPLNDDEKTIDFIRQLWSDHDGKQSSYSSIVTAILQWKEMWGSDLTQLPGLRELTTQYLREITEQGMPPAVEKLVRD